MSRSLPLRASLEWLRKHAKDRLEEIRRSDPSAKLSDAQRELAHEYGFVSWRRLVARVEETRRQLDALVPPERLESASRDEVPADDADLARLLAAIEAGESQTVADLVTRRPALARAGGPGGITPLHAAAQCNDPALAALLVAHGAEVEARYGTSGHTALTWAITCNALECARALQRMGARPDLFSAAGLGDLEHVRSCFDAAGELIPGSSRMGSSRFGLDGRRLPCPPETDRERVSDALVFGCRNGQADVVDFLLTRGPDLCFRAFLGATALHWAYFGGSRRVVAALLEAGADPEARDDSMGCLPRTFGVCAPASWGFAFLVQRRLDEDASLARFMDGRTSALHEAAKAGRLEVVRLLIDHGADATLKNGDGRTPLELAISAGHEEVAAVLRSEGNPSTG